MEVLLSKKRQQNSRNEVVDQAVDQYPKLYIQEMISKRHRNA